MNSKYKLNQKVFIEGRPTPGQIIDIYQNVNKKDIFVYRVDFDWDSVVWLWEADIQRGE
jgi:hypothetical protein